MPARRLLFGILAGVLASGTAAAQPGSSLAPNWNQLSDSDRKKAQEKYEIYKRMPSDRQQEIQESYRDWQNMKPSEREKIRRNYKAYRDLTPEQRRAVGRLYDSKRKTR